MHHNITSGYKSTGILPFNQSTFNAYDFVASHVTETRSPDNLVDDCIQTSSFENDGDSDGVLFPSKPSSSTQILISNSFVTASKHEANVSSPVIPEAIRPYPKAFHRKTKQLGKKPGKSHILTSTPEKNRIEGKVGEKQNKKEKFYK